MRREPILETETSVSYFGIRLEKAQDASGPSVPDRAKFTDYVNYSLSLDLQRRLAVAFSLGDPILIEGETGIGKTLAVKKMAADLGWEVHALQFHSRTTVEDLVGLYVPNTESNEPAYFFSDGPVTTGLRRQEGRTKVILLEDLNLTMENGPAVHGMLKQILDALKRNGTVVIPRRVHKVLKPRYGPAIFPREERIEVSRAKTKVVALVCPPAPELGYIGRDPLDLGFLRRWDYQKIPGGRS